MSGRGYWLPRCGAYARSTGQPCRRKPVLNPDGSIRNGRCLNHGGASTGPKKHHDRCTAGRIAYYQRRREEPLPRKLKPAPAAMRQRHHGLRYRLPRDGRTPSMRSRRNGRDGRRISAGKPEGNSPTNSLTPAGADCQSHFSQNSISPKIKVITRNFDRWGYPVS